jgi:hypothetical protein
MVNWNITIGELVKKLNEDGIDLTNMDDASAMGAIVGTFKTAQNEVVTAIDEDIAQKALEAKIELFTMKNDEFFERTKMRMGELVKTEGSYDMSVYVSLLTQAFTEVKNEMISEIQGE